MATIVFPLLLAVFGTLGAIFFVRWAFPKFGLLDRPERYGFSRAPVPYPAGTIFPILFSALACVVLLPSAALFGFIAAGAVLATVSFLDDRFFLSPWLRLAVQFGVSAIVIFSGIGIEFVANPFGGAIDLREPLFLLGQFSLTVSEIFTIVWLLLIINAFNWLDGVSGQTSSVAAIAFFVIAALAFRVGQHEIALLSFCFGISSAIFFWFDFPMPKILMGDTGSMFLGFTIAILSILSSGKVATAFLVLGVPLFDAFRTIVRRIAQRKSPLRGDLEHFHHQLLRSGLSARQTVVVVASISALFGLSALFLSGFGKFWAIVLLAFLIETILWGAARAKNPNRPSSNSTGCS